MERFNPNDSPTVLFCVLEMALRKGDFHRAAKIRDQLADLGYRVNVQLPPKDRRQATATKAGACRPAEA